MHERYIDIAQNGATGQYLLIILSGCSERMNRRSERNKDSLTKTAEKSSVFINDDDGDSAMSRRALLMTAGLATASVAGCIGRNGDNPAVMLQGVDVYGYGGKQVLAKASQTVTVKESEPNDQRNEAMAVDLGTQISGDLETAGVDWFAFNADSGQTVVAEFSRAVTDGVTSIIIYDSDGDHMDLRFIGADQPVQVDVTAPASGTYYVEVVDVQASAGEYTLTLTSPSETPTQTETATPTPTQTETATPTPDDGQDPFGGQMVSLPGRIQAQNFDTGGEGVAYHDTTSENKYDTAYRTGAVDIRETQDVSGTYNIGYFEKGEWLEYTVDTTAGTYDVHLRVATPRDDRQLRLLLGDTTLATVDVPNTGGWHTWQTTTVRGLTIDTDDSRVLHVEAVNSGIDFNWVEFERTEETQTSTATPTVTTVEDDYGEQGYGEYGYGGVDT